MPSKYNVVSLLRLDSDTTGRIKAENLLPPFPPAALMPVSLAL